MAQKTITLTAEEMEKRIAFASRALSRKKFTEKQLKQYIVNGKVPGESKRTKSGYQLYLDEFRKDLSKEERANVGKVAKDGAAAWKAMDDDEKAPFLEKATKLREEALGDQPVKEKKPRGRPKKAKDPETDDEVEDDSEVEEPEIKTPLKKAKKSAKKPTKKVQPEESDDESPEPEVKTPPKKKAKKEKKATKKTKKAKKTQDSDEE